MLTYLTSECDLSVISFFFNVGKCLFVSICKPCDLYNWLGGYFLHRACLA